MALAFTVRVGQTVEMRHREHGPLGAIRVEHKTGNAIRLIFDMPRSVIIRVLNHRATQTSFGLRGEARGPVNNSHLNVVAV